MFNPCGVLLECCGSLLSWVPWALYAARRVCVDPGVHCGMVLGDRLRESLLCQVQPPGGPLDRGRTRILFEQGRWFGFSDGKMGRLGVTLHTGTWVNGQQWSAPHPQPQSQWSSTDPRAVLTQKDEDFRKAETRQCVKNPLREACSFPSCSWGRASGGRSPGAAARVQGLGWGLARGGGPIHLLLVATGPHMLDYASPLQRVEQNQRSVFQTRVCYCSGNLEF